MDPKEYVPESHEDLPAPHAGLYTLTVSDDELQVIELALGELLETARRGEHLIATIQALQTRLSTLHQAS